MIDVVFNRLAIGRLIQEIATDIRSYAGRHRAIAIGECDAPNVACDKPRYRSKRSAHERDDRRSDGSSEGRAYRFTDRLANLFCNKTDTRLREVSQRCFCTFLDKGFIRMPIVDHSIGEDNWSGRVRNVYLERKADIVSSVS